MTITNCERKVLEVLYKLEQPATLRTVCAVVNEDRSKPWAVQTVSTFISRAISKGYIVAERKGRGNVYSPAKNYYDYLQEVLIDLRDTAFAGDLELMKQMVMGL